MMLSPRGIYLEPKQCGKVNGKETRKGYVVCSCCRYSLHRCRMPKYAIANNMYFGSTPECLLCLTHCELAYLSPVKTRGYCFTFTGGKCLKGSLSYYKVDPDEIAKAVGKINALGAKVVILITGKMTAWQKHKAKQHSSMVVQKLVNALVC